MTPVLTFFIQCKEKLELTVYMCVCSRDVSVGVLKALVYIDFDFSVQC